METKSPKIKTIDLVYIALMAALMAICSWISIPATIPFTLQTFAVFVAVGLLGGKRGTISVFVYIMLGLVGIPVFAGFTATAKLIGPTGGYIVGFLFSALAMWLMEKLLGSKLWVLAVSSLIGLVICYAFGTVWFMILYAQNNSPITIGTALSWCVIPYIIPDVIKIVLAVIIAKTLRPIIKN